MQGDIPPKIIKRQECKYLLERISFSVDVAQTIVQDHSYDTAKKLSHMKTKDIDILIKTLCAPGREHADRTRDPGISIPHSTHRALISVCFILFHCIQCDLHPSLNLIVKSVIYWMDLQLSREDKHGNDLFCKDRPKFDAADPKRSITNIREYIESLSGTNKAPCSNMLCPYIVLFMHKNQAIGLWQDPDKMMIERCPIIPIE